MHTFAFGVSCPLPTSSRAQVSISVLDERRSLRKFRTRRSQALVRAQIGDRYRQSETQNEMEDGVSLPRPENSDALKEESMWLQSEVTNWLETEWQQTEPQEIHDEIGRRTGQIYERQRMEGQDDLTSVMIAIGSELEGMNFAEAFVGPWNVANRAAELLLERHSSEMDKKEKQKESRVGEQRKWESEVDKMLQEERIASARQKVKPPVLEDRFEKLRFLKQVLDGKATTEEISGAVGEVIGFQYDAESGVWNADAVKDDFFRQFGNSPPDVLGDEDSKEMSEALAYMEKRLYADEESVADLRSGLDMIVETLHGAEITRIQRDDENDHAFRKRSIVAKWLHYFGGF